MSVCRLEGVKLRFTEDALRSVAEGSRAPEIRGRGLRAFWKKSCST